MLLTPTDLGEAGAQTVDGEHPFPMRIVRAAPFRPTPPRAPHQRSTLGCSCAQAAMLKNTRCVGWKTKLEKRMLAFSIGSHRAPRACMVRQVGGAAGTNRVRPRPSAPPSIHY